MERGDNYEQQTQQSQQHYSNQGMPIGNQQSNTKPRGKIVFWLTIIFICCLGVTFLNVKNSLEDKIASCNKLIEEKDQNIDELNIQLSKASSELKSYKEKVKTYERKIELYEEKIDTYENDIEEYKAEIEEYKTELEDKSVTTNGFIGEVVDISYASIYAGYVFPTEIYIHNEKYDKMQISVSETSEFTLKNWLISNDVYDWGREDNKILHVYGSLGTYGMFSTKYSVESVYRIDILDNDNNIISTWYNPQIADRSKKAIEYIDITATELLYLGNNREELNKYNSRSVTLSGTVEDIEEGIIYLNCDSDGYNSVGAEPLLVVYAKVADSNKYSIGDNVSIKGVLQCYNYAVALLEY